MRPCHLSLKLSHHWTQTPKPSSLRTAPGEFAGGDTLLCAHMWRDMEGLRTIGSIMKVFVNRCSILIFFCSGLMSHNEKISIKRFNMFDLSRLISTFIYPMYIISCNIYSPLASFLYTTKSVSRTMNRCGETLRMSCLLVGQTCL